MSAATSSPLHPTIVNGDSANPILRWAGSKRLLLPKLLSLAPPNYGTYVEPFCGSACFFLALQPRRAVLNDLNPHLIATYKQVRARPAAVAAAMTEWKATKSTYLTVRRKVEADPVRAAARFLYLNRYSFNGVYRENRHGHFNVPFAASRNGRLVSALALEAFSSALGPARLLCSDFEAVIYGAKHGDFLYLDPPYHYGETRNRGEYGLGSFSDADLDRFLEAVLSADRRGVQVLISYNKPHKLRKVLSGWKLAYCTTRRSVAGFAHARRSVREYFLRNY